MVNSTESCTLYRNLEESGSLHSLVTFLVKVITQHDQGLFYPKRRPKSGLIQITYLIQDYLKLYHQHLLEQPAHEWNISSRYIGHWGPRRPCSGEVSQSLISKQWELYLLHKHLLRPGPSQPIYFIYLIIFITCPSYRIAQDALTNLSVKKLHFHYIMCDSYTSGLLCCWVLDLFVYKKQAYKCHQL